MSVCALTAAAAIPDDIVTLENGQPVTTSLKIAEYFGKKHKIVLEAIHNLNDACPERFTGQNFLPSEYADATGRKLPMYFVAFKGFMLLAMGFTGKKALQIKLAFIDAFERLQRTVDELSRKLCDAGAIGAEILAAVDEKISAFGAMLAQHERRIADLIGGRAGHPAGKAKDAGCAKGLLPLLPPSALDRKRKELAELIMRNLPYFAEQGRTINDLGKLGLKEAAGNKIGYSRWVKKENFPVARKRGPDATAFNFTKFPKQYAEYVPQSMLADV